MYAYVYTRKWESVYMNNICKYMNIHAPRDKTRYRTDTINTYIFKS